MVLNGWRPCEPGSQASVLRITNSTKPLVTPRSKVTWTEDRTYLCETDARLRESELYESSGFHPEMVFLV